MSSTHAAGQSSKRSSRAEAAGREVSRFVWRTKYQGGGERSVADSWRRIAGAVASVEQDPAAWEARFLGVMRDFRFLPGGRIQAGAGVDSSAVLFNCFVLPGPTGSVDASLSALRESVLTLCAGGGIGCDFSAVPPRGQPIAGGPPSPGAAAFLDLWDGACRTFLAEAPRRGAMMAALNCAHPDVQAFADAKRVPGALSRFNLSIAITDAFMAAVRADRDWALEFPIGGSGDRAAGSVKARVLWEQILRSAYDTGEPGVLFVDRINRANNLWWREQIAVTNPCGEIPLPAHGACDLGSLNLTRFVVEPFMPQARLDLEALAESAAVAVRFLDNVIDLSGYPLPEQRQAAQGSRRIGLGITGLADALVMLGLRYGEPASLDLAAAAMRVIRDAAYRASTALAREKGAFPFFDRAPYLQGEFVKRLPADIREGVAAHGIRNSHLLAIAPTGSISLLAGGLSTGLEPIFARIQMRRILGRDGQPRRFRIVDPALALWRSLRGVDAGEPPAFVTAHELSLAAHLDMQAALQPYVDNAISKTVNIAPDLSFEAFRAVYDEAFDRGLKGCTVFRSTAGADTHPSEGPAAGCPAEVVCGPGA